MAARSARHPKVPVRVESSNEGARHDSAVQAPCPSGQGGRRRGGVSWRRSQLAADLLNPVPAQLLLAQGEVAAAADGHSRQPDPLAGTRSRPTGQHRRLPALGTCAGRAGFGFRCARWIAAFRRITTSKSGDWARRPSPTLLLLVYAISEAPQVGWGSARTVTLLAVSAALLAAFLVVETRTERPARYRRRAQVTPSSGGDHVPAYPRSLPPTPLARNNPRVGISLTHFAPPAMDFGPSAGHKEGEHASVQSQAGRTPGAPHR